MQDLEPTEYEPYLKFRWNAIFAGAISAVSIQIALSVLGFAIGMTRVQPLVSSNPLSGFSIWGGIWWLVSGLISIAIGAFIAGHLTATNSLKEGEAIGV